MLIILLFVVHGEEFRSPPLRPELVCKCVTVKPTRHRASRCSCSVTNVLAFILWTNKSPKLQSRLSVEEKQGMGGWRRGPGRRPRAWTRVERDRELQRLENPEDPLPEAGRTARTPGGLISGVRAGRYNRTHPRGHRGRLAAGEPAGRWEGRLTTLKSR